MRKEDPKTKQPIMYDIGPKIDFAVFPGLQVRTGKQSQLQICQGVVLYCHEMCRVVPSVEHVGRDNGCGAVLF